MVPIDSSEKAEKAFDFYTENIYKEGDTVIFVHVQVTPHSTAGFTRESTAGFTRGDGILPSEWTAKVMEAAEKAKTLVNHFEQKCNDLKIPNKTVLESGKPGEVIAKSALDQSANIIVMGSRGMNAIRRTFVGSVSDYVLHHVHIPVVVIP